MANEISALNVGTRSYLATTPAKLAQGGNSSMQSQGMRATGGEIALSAQYEKYSEGLDRQDSLERMAVAVRSYDDFLAEMGGHLSGMKKALLGIVKQYPPYPMESKERLEYLNSISGLRQQIEAIATLGELSEMGLGENRTTVRLSDGSSVSLNEAFGRLSPKDIDIPQLGDRASDQEVVDVLAKVQQAEQELMAERQYLAAEIRTLAGTEVEEAHALMLSLFARS